MSKNKLLSSSILLFVIWGICFFVIKVGGEVHLMLFFSLLSFLTHYFHHRNMALKH